MLAHPRSSYTKPAVCGPVNKGTVSTTKGKTIVLFCFCCHKSGMGLHRGMRPDLQSASWSKSNPFSLFHTHPGSHYRLEQLLLSVRFMKPGENI